MKILNFLNVSNPNNLEADSGFIFQKLLMQEIIRRRRWKFYFICAKNSPLNNPLISKIEILRSSNKYMVRFDFDWTALKRAILNILDDIDLVIINQPEQAASLYALIATLSDRKIPFIVYYHYVPIIPAESSIGQVFSYDATLNKANLARIIISRNAEAALVSERRITCSNFAKNLLKFMLGYASSDKQDIDIIPPPVSTELAWRANEQSNLNGQRKKVIVYNHRLYRTYGTKTLIRFLEHFYDSVRKDFTLLVTDPTFGRSGERDLLDKDVRKFREELAKLPFVEFHHGKTQEEYFKLIGASIGGLAPMKRGALWSMGVVDVLACGKPVLCPNYAAFPEIVNWNEAMLYSSLEELRIKLNRLIDNKYEKSGIGKICQEQASQFDSKECAKKFIHLIERVTKN